MRIDPSLPKPPRPTATEGRDPSIRDFADLLGKQGGGDEVATFSELPVFGRPHAVTAPTHPTAPERPGSAALPSAGPMPAGGAKPADSPCAGPPAPASATTAQPSAAASHRIGDTKVCVPKSEGPVLAEPRAGEDAGPQAPDAPLESDPLRRARPRIRQTAPKAGISLILHEEDGEVSLVVGQGPLDPEQSAEARRLAAHILAESGLALAHFQLNGAPLGPDSTGKKGGRHGTRSN